MLILFILGTHIYGRLKTKENVLDTNISQMMGTAGEVLKAPEKPVMFVEDMNNEQLAQVVSY
jgi:hypothetical protein